MLDLNSDEWQDWGGGRGGRGGLQFFLPAQTEVSFKKELSLRFHMLRYHDLIVAINFDVQEVNISNLLKILDNFYIFIRLEREKNYFGRWE